MDHHPISGDSSLLKSINKSTLLTLIRKSSSVSRAELAKRTKLTRATVSTLVEELIAAHLVTESGTGASSGGRKPLLLELNRHAGYALGIDLRSTDMLAVCMDIQGNTVSRRTYAYDRPSSAVTTMRQVAAIVRAEAAGLPASPLGLIGVGIGVHGFVEYPGGRILFAPHQGWKGADWRPALERELGVPVWIDNEANLAALGEVEFGAATQCSQVLYVSVGAGIGAGLVLGGDVFRGALGIAGEVGHTTIERGGRLCSCGNRGCWEQYASEKALAESLGLPYSPDSTETVLNLLQSHDPAALRQIAELGQYLSIGIGNMIHVLNPQMVIIGNKIGRYREWLTDVIQAGLDERFPDELQRQTVLHYSALGPEACAVGAASLVIRNLMRV